MKICGKSRRVRVHLPMLEDALWGELEDGDEVSGSTPILDEALRAKLDLHNLRVFMLPSGLCVIQTHLTNRLSMASERI